MLTATKASFWSSDWAIDLDGTPVTTWQNAAWSGRAGFVLEGRQCSVRPNFWGSRYELSSDPGGLVAVAEAPRRKYWRITANGQRFDFQRASAWRSEQWLMSPVGQPVGSIRRASVWSGGAVADLPGVPLLVQVFAVGVLLTVWRRNAAAAASA